MLDCNIKVLEILFPDDKQGSFFNFVDELNL